MLLKDRITMNKNKIDDLSQVARSIALAQLQTRDFKHVSFILHRNRIQAVGTNCRGKTHPEAKRLGYLFDERHSELDAYLKLRDKSLRGLSLVNFRFNNQGEMRLSRPCYRCLPWVCNLFDEVYHSSNDGQVIQLL